MIRTEYRYHAAVITEQLDNITDKYIDLKDMEMVPDESGIQFI